jgi:peroxiredoxin
MRIGGMHNSDDAARTASAGSQTPAPVQPTRSPASSQRARLFRAAVAVGAAAALIAFVWAVLQPAQSGPTSNKAPGASAPLVGHYAPDATLLDLRNNHVSLSSLRGKVVVLNFWYVACPPCQTEMPALEKAYLADQGHGLVVVGVNVSDDAQTISTFLTKLGITYPVWRDLGQRATLTYQLTDTPTSFFIDRQGIIRYKVVGPLDTSVLTRYSSALLADS